MARNSYKENSILLPAKETVTNICIGNSNVSCLFRSDANGKGGSVCENAYTENPDISQLCYYFRGCLDYVPDVCKHHTLVSLGIGLKIARLDVMLNKATLSNQSSYRSTQYFKLLHDY